MRSTSLRLAKDILSNFLNFDSPKHSRHQFAIYRLEDLSVTNVIAFTMIAKAACFVTQGNVFGSPLFD